MSVRLAVRTLRRSPAYVATVVCTIALTITLAATTFAIVDGVLFAVQRPGGGTPVTVVGEVGDAPGWWVGYVVAEAPGTWRVRVTCSTPQVAVDEGEFRVRTSTLA